MTQKFPDESIQSVLGLESSWWGRVPGQTLTRGSLVRTIVPYPEQKPYRLLPTGRGDDSRQHAKADYRVEQFRVGDRPEVSTLPVAALPLRDGEDYIVRRGKLRPCLTLASTAPVAGSLTRGYPRWQTARTRLVVPYYSANGTSSRGGWPPELVVRIRECEYPQYFWDKLPLPASSTEGSILCWSHAFSIGHDPAGVIQTGYQLDPTALEVLEEWFGWYITGALARGGDVDEARELLMSLRSAG